MKIYPRWFESLSQLDIIRDEGDTWSSSILYKSNGKFLRRRAKRDGRNKEVGVWKGSSNEKSTPDGFLGISMGCGWDRGSEKDNINITSRKSGERDSFLC